jgi:hypothetical protein
MQQEKTGFLAVVLASSCCLLPLLLIAAGLGGSLLTVVLVRYKAYLMTAALAALGYAWVQYRRDVRRCASGACILVGGRFRKTMLVASTTVVALFFLITYTPVGSFASVLLQGGTDLPRLTNNQAQVSPPVTERPSLVTTARGASEQTQGLEKLTLRVDGMT